jgi:hypothetical protein
MSRFLPKPSADFAYPIDRKQVAEGGDNRDFSDQAIGLIEDIGRQMAVDKTDSEGRVPSPFSPAYMFYYHLYGDRLGARVGGAGTRRNVVEVPKDRVDYQLRARNAFRGICAAFALREVYGLNIALETVSPTAWKGLPPQELKRAFADSFQTAPRSPQGPGWDTIRLFKVNSDHDVRVSRVIVGLSPLTGFFPAASRMRGFKPLFWYDDDSGRWRDPTVEFSPTSTDLKLRASEETINIVRDYIKSWLTHVLKAVKEADLRAFGMEKTDADLFLDLLGEWSQEIKADGQCPILAQSIADGVFPIFDYVVQPAKSDRGPTVLRTELPVVNGYALVSKSLLSDSSKRLFGAVRGSETFVQEDADGSSKFEELRDGGDDLAAAMGMHSHGRRIPYIVLESLFTPSLTRITDEGLAPEWKSFEINTGQKTETYLFPFKAEILQIVPSDEIRRRTSSQVVRKNPVAVHVTFRFEKDVVVGQTYSANPSSHEKHIEEDTLRNRIDVRVFPRFDLHAKVMDQGNEVFLVRNEEDRSYFTRIRRSPYWNFAVEMLASDEQGTLVRQAGSPAWVIANRAHQLVDRTAEFRRLDWPQIPLGFSVDGKGLCFLKLPSPIQPGTNLRRYTIGIDFGTTNTCITYTDGGGDPNVLQIPALASALYRKPVYDHEFHPPQGADDRIVRELTAATLDFFTSASDDGMNILMEGDSLPTQFISRQSEPWLGDIPPLKINNGLLLTTNIGVADRTVSALLKGFPAQAAIAKGDSYQPLPVLNYYDELKWPEQSLNGAFQHKNTIWRGPFMINLRLLTILTVALHGAQISRVRFSFPKALPYLYRRSYEQMLQAVWHSEVSSEKGLLVTESEAARNWLMTTAPANEHIMLDMGGGTTDILALFNGRPFYQASYLLAGKQINDYALGSHSFRLALLETCKPILGDQGIIADLLKAKDGIDHYFLRQGWFALLGKMNVERTRICTDLRDVHKVSDARKPAVRGFFLSVALLFGGLSFLAGKLMRIRLEQDAAARARGLIQVDLWLAGNAAKFYDMLSGGVGSAESFHNVMVRLFKAGLEFQSPLPSMGGANIAFRGIPRADQREIPKSLIARGLLCDGAGSAGELPLVRNDADLLFYENVNPEVHRTEPFPQEIEYFLRNFDEALPAGFLGQLPVIPFSGGRLFDELQQRYRSAAVQAWITHQEKVNAQWLKLAREEPTNGPNSADATEALFVARLRGLLLGVLKKYG